jgi:hypothetical protein
VERLASYAKRSQSYFDCGDEVPAVGGHGTTVPGVFEFAVVDGEEEPLESGDPEFVELELFEPVPLAESVDPVVDEFELDEPALAEFGLDELFGVLASGKCLS